MTIWKLKEYKAHIKLELVTDWTDKGYYRASLSYEPYQTLVHLTLYGGDGPTNLEPVEEFNFSTANLGITINRLRTIIGDSGYKFDLPTAEALLAFHPQLDVP